MDRMVAKGYHSAPPLFLPGTIYRTKRLIVVK